MTKGLKTGGRTLGVPNKATREVKAAAQIYGPAAIKRLAELAGLTNKGRDAAESEQAQVAACKEILDRGYGKSAQAIIPQNEDGTPFETRIPIGELARSIAFVLRRGAA